MKKTHRSIAALRNAAQARARARALARRRRRATSWSSVSGSRWLSSFWSWTPAETRAAWLAFDWSQGWWLGSTRWALAQA